MQKGLVACLGILMMALTVSGWRALQSPPLPIIYFDLGNVLIETRDPQGFHYTPGASAYLQTLLGKGYKLGLISNVPESWGATQAEKLVKLKAYVAQTWQEPAPFPWEIFGQILLPPTDALRKPNPYLFRLALETAGVCRPVYEGEDADEIKVAQQTGFDAFLLTAPVKVLDLHFPSPETLTCHSRTKGAF